MKIKQYIFIARPEEFITGGTDCFILLADKKLEGWNGGYLLVAEIEFEVNIDEGAIRQSVLASLDTKETQLRAEFEMSLGEIEEKRQSLLAIEHKQ